MAPGARQAANPRFAALLSGLCVESVDADDAFWVGGGGRHVKRCQLLDKKFGQNWQVGTPPVHSVGPAQTPVLDYGTRCIKIQLKRFRSLDLWDLIAGPAIGIMFMRVGIGELAAGEKEQPFQMLAKESAASSECEPGIVGSRWIHRKKR